MLIRPIKSTVDAREQNYEIFVALDHEEKAYGRLYIDDGTTFNYQKVCILTIANNSFKN